MAVQVAVIAANTILPFIKKHPWVLILLILASLTPIILVIALFGAVSSAVGEIKIPTVASYCQFETSNWTKPANIDFEGQVKKCGGSSIGGDKFTVDGEWTLPVADGTKVSSGFGNRCIPFTSDCADHLGVDFDAGEGAPIYAAAAGKVIKVATGTVGGCSQAYLNTASGVVLDNGNDTTTMYWHMQAGSVAVKVGETVKAGQFLGRVGATGYACGPHLHFQMQQNGPCEYGGKTSGCVDPAKWYASIGKPLIF